MSASSGTLDSGDLRRIRLRARPADVSPCISATQTEATAPGAGSAPGVVSSLPRHRSLPRLCLLHRQALIERFCSGLIQPAVQLRDLFGGALFNA